VSRCSVLCGPNFSAEWLGIAAPATQDWDAVARTRKAMEDAGYSVNRHSAHQLIKALAASGQHDRIMDVHRQLINEGWKVRCVTPLSIIYPGRPILLRC
jgi:hypothetical protein